MSEQTKTVTHKTSLPESKMATRSIQINRGGPGGRASVGGVGMGRMSGSGSSARNSMASFSPGVMTAFTSSGLTDFRGNREKEKKELQSLNERLADYIQKVHYLQTENKKLEAENEALRNRKTEDLQPIRDTYEAEINQARKIIDELSSNKGVAEGKIANLQDEVAQLRDLIGTYENQSKDYRKKIDSLSNSIGEYEGELHTLRLRVGSLEDENTKLRELIDKLQDQIRSLRADLDTETAAHIDSECAAQTAQEEAAFYKDLWEKAELMKPEPLQIKGVNAADFWKNEMSKCVRALNATYDEKLDIIQADNEAKLAAQLQTMRSGTVKDNLALGKLEEENKRLKSQMAEKSGGWAEMSSKMAALQAERDRLAMELSQMQSDMDRMRIEYEGDIMKLQGELEGVQENIRTLMDAKLSMELEIACYKKLLEQEEGRVGIRSLVEQAIGTQSKGAGSLADVIQSSS